MRKYFLIGFGLLFSTQAFAAPPYSRPSIGQYKAPTYTPPPPVRMPSTTPPISVPHIETPKNFTNPQPVQNSYKYKYEPLPYQQIPYNNVKADGIKSDKLRGFYYSCFLHLPQTKFFNSAMAANSFNENLDEFVTTNAKNKNFEVPDWVEPKLSEIEKIYAKEIMEWDDADVDSGFFENFDFFVNSFNNCLSLIGKNPADYHLIQDAKIQKIGKYIKNYDAEINKNFLSKYNYAQLTQAGNFIKSIENHEIILKAMSGTPTGDKFSKLKARYEIANSQAKGDYKSSGTDSKIEKFDCIIEDSPPYPRTQFNVESSFPLQALSKNISGSVIADIQVDEHGNVTNVNLTVSDPIFGGEFMENRVRAMKYYPATKNCVATSSSTHMTIKFLLD